MFKRTKFRRKSVLSIFLCLLLLMATFPSSSLALEDDAFSIYLEKIEVNGTEVFEEVPVGPFSTEDQVTFTYGWEIDDSVEESDGETVQITLPDVFADATISGHLYDKDGASYGEWDVLNGVLTLNFNAFAGPQFNVSGGVSFSLNFEMEEVRVDEPYELVIPIDGELSKSYLLEFEVPTDLESIAKQGSIDSDTGIITWVIDVNQDLGVVGDLEIIDELDRRLSLDEPPVVNLYSLHVLSNGDVEQGDLLGGIDPLDDRIVLSPDVDTPHTLTFQIPASAGGDEDVAHAYRIVYETTVNPELVEPTELEFTYDNKASLGSASSSAEVTRTGDTIIKKMAPESLETNQREFTWNILVNEAKYSLNNVRIEDVLPDGLEIVDLANDVKVLDEDLIEVSPSNVTYNAASRKLTVLFGDIENTGTNKITKTYTISVKTNITDSYLEDLDTNGNRYYKLDFDNSATIFQTFEDEEYSTTHTAEIDDLKFGKIIYKSGAADIGYNAEKYVNWVLDVNLGELNTNLTQVTDTVGSDLLMPAEGDIVITPLTINENGAIDDSADPLDSGYDIDITGSIITVDFDSPITQAYRITYRTKIDPEAYAEDGTLNLQNTGTIGFGEGKSYTAKERPTIRNAFTKGATDVNYENNEISWRIQINPLREGVDGLSIVDTLSPELMLTQDQFDAITVAVNQGIAPVKGTDYTVSRQPATGKIKGFTIDFINNYQLNDAVYTIDYVSSMDPDVIVESSYTYGNTITYSWDDGEVGPVTVYPEIDQEHAQNNGSKKGSLVVDEQKINWTIFVNHLSKNLTDYEVSDVVYQTVDGDGEALISGSVQILPYTVDQDNNITTGVALTQIELSEAGIEVQEDLENNSLSVVFNGLLSTPYQIQYSTQLVGISSTLYQNEATTSLGESYKASVSFEKGETFVTKSGDYDGDYVYWEIMLNESRSDITSLTLLDSMSAGLEWDEDYYFWMKDSTGALVDFDDYFEVEWLDKEIFSDPTQFRLTTKESVVINDMYTIGYRALIEPDDLISDTFENKVVFEGEKVETGQRSSTESITHNILTGTGWGSGEVGSISILKTNPEEMPLAGAEFEVYRINSDDTEVYLGTITTNDLGIATMGNLRNFIYRVQETGEPEGYLLPLGEEAVITFEISSDNLEPSYTIINEPERTLTILKRNVKDNSDGSPFYLEGAKFLVTKVDDDSFEETLITNSDGSALLEGLEYGTYMVEETKAPSGYKLNRTPIEITIDDSQVDYEVEFFNERDRTGGTTTPDPEDDPVIDPEPEVDPVIDPEPEPVPEPEPTPADESELVDGDRDPAGLPFTGARDTSSFYWILLALGVTGVIAKKRLEE